MRIPAGATLFSWPYSVLRSHRLKLLTQSHPTFGIHHQGLAMQKPLQLASSGQRLPDTKPITPYKRCHSAAALVIATSAALAAAASFW